MTIVQAKWVGRCRWKVVMKLLLFAPMARNFFHSFRDLISPKFPVFYEEKFPYYNAHGKSNVCLEWCLDICATARKGRCQFKHHAAIEDSTDTFAHSLCQALTPGVQHVLRLGPTM